MNLQQCSGSAIKQRYKKGQWLALTSLLLTCIGIAGYAWNHTPQGWMLYALAALPSFSIFAMIVNVGRYLAAETDEFERDQLIRCILWGTGTLLMASTFLSVLRELGWEGKVPFLMELGAFCWAIVIARWSYQRSNRIVDE